MLPGARVTSQCRIRTVELDVFGTSLCCRCQCSPLKILLILDGGAMAMY